MEYEEAKQLLLKYKANECTETERALVEDWIMQHNENASGISQERGEEIGEQIFKELPWNKSDNTKLWTVIVTVAATLLLIAFAAFFYFKNPSAPAQSARIPDIAPGGNHATLTLASGKTINLNTAKAGIVINGTRVSYTDGTAISRQGNNDLSGLATITTPKGGEYQIVLSDGTKVWLNAASTLLYPSTFKERGIRKVELRGGEAYFQVAKDKKHPFIVLTGHHEVEVLGTHFNVNAYEPDNIKTTLLEGSVKIASQARNDWKLARNNIKKPMQTANEVIIKPGEQSTYADDNITVKNVDVDMETAWKNGKTEFRNADLKTVMRMLERWYNIDVIYNGVSTDSYYSGSVSRTRNISEVLQLLESTGEVHFKITGRRVEILK